MAKEKKQSKELDQYYTGPELAQYFLDKVQELLPYADYDMVLEPSAGTGSFYNLLDTRRVGLDLDPKCTGVQKQNFYDYMAPIPHGKILTVGNPPFGKNASDAVKFFNHSAKFSQAIAFVLPRTFRKTSLINRLDENFHLIFDETVPDQSFIHEGKPYDVWCTMQIWIRKENKREKIATKKLSDAKDYWEIVEPKLADFCVQRVGGRAGQVRTGADFRTFSPLSHYFIRAIDPNCLDIFKSLNYEDLKYNTAGNPSISPSELVELFFDEAQKRNTQKIT
jgi:hypothetical protein